MLIVFAGPAFNMISAVIIFYFVYLIGVPSLLTTIGTVEESFPAAAAGSFSTSCRSASDQPRRLILDANVPPF